MLLPTPCDHTSSMCPSSLIGDGGGSSSLRYRQHADEHEHGRAIAGESCGVPGVRLQRREKADAARAVSWCCSMTIGEADPHWTRCQPTVSFTVRSGVQTAAPLAPHPIGRMKRYSMCLSIAELGAARFACRLRHRHDVDPTIRGPARSGRHSPSRQAAIADATSRDNRSRTAQCIARGPKPRTASRRVVLRPTRHHPQER